MRVSRFIASLFTLIALSCSSTAPGSDAGPRMDSGSAVDASRADAGSTDAGIDCSTIGCGAPVVCGEACTDSCGCCACAEGEEIEIGGATYVCSGGCYAPRGTLGNDEECESTPDCSAGLSCCYPCGIPGCMNRCTPTCAEGTPGCAGGCMLAS